MASRWLCVSAKCAPRQCFLAERHWWSCVAYAFFGCFCFSHVFKLWQLPIQVFHACRDQGCSYRFCAEAAGASLFPVPGRCCPCLEAEWGEQRLESAQVRLFVMSSVLYRSR